MSGPEKQWAPPQASVPLRAEVAEGTRCAPCAAKGHYCAAQEIENGQAVCYCCLDGVACPKVARTRGGQDNHLPGAKQATVAIKAHESIAAAAAIPGPLATSERYRELKSAGNPPAAVQPALAAGAMPSPAMPPRRAFGRQVCNQCKQAVHTGPCLCVRGCGKPRHRGNCNGTARKAVPMGVREACVHGYDPLTCKVCSSDAVKVTETVAEGAGALAYTDGSPVSLNGVVTWMEVAPRQGPAKPQNVAVKLNKAEEKVQPAKPAEVAQVQAALSEKCAAEGYSVLSLAEVPGRKYMGVYDYIVEEFMKLPKRTVLTKTYDNRDIANTYMLALVRIGRKRGLKMRQKQDGNTIFVLQI